jgi:hypothetical protein
VEPSETAGEVPPLWQLELWGCGTRLVHTHFSLNRAEGERTWSATLMSAPYSTSLRASRPLPRYAATCSAVAPMRFSESGGTPACQQRERKSGEKAPTQGEGTD